MSKQKVPAVAVDEPAESRTCEANATCPLCSFVGTDESDIYVHLQTSHRKSTIATAVLEDEAPQPVTPLDD